jgi:hypothetical protein
MPTSAPANYTATNEQLSRVPVYALEIAGEALPWSTLPIIGQSSVKQLTNVKGLAASIEPRHGRASLAKSSVVLVDNNNLATALVTVGLLGREVTLKGGFRELDYSDYATLGVGIIEGVRNASDLGSGYEVSFRDFRTLENRSVFEVATTTLSAPATDSDVTLSLTQTTFLMAAGYLVLGTGEIVQYTGKTSTTVTGVTRGALGTTAAAQDAGSSVVEMIRLTGHILDVAQAVMTDTDKAGMSIDVSRIDTAAFTAAKALLGDCDVDFRIVSRQNGKQWLEEQIFKPIAGYPLTTADGKISIRLFRQPTAAEVAGTLAEAENVVEFSSFEESPDDLINVVTFRYDYNSTAQVYDTSVEAATSAASIAQYGRRELVILSHGLRTGGLGVADFITTRAEEILRRYKSGSARVNVTTFLNRHLINVGDIIQATSKKLPNKFRGTKGITGSLMEIINAQVDYAKGKVTFALQATGFKSTVPLIGPNTLPVWTLATDQQRELYGYVVNAAGLHSDGVEGKVIA